jgi:hypothetical protein
VDKMVAALNKAFMLFHGFARSSPPDQKLVRAFAAAYGILPIGSQASDGHEEFAFKGHHGF